MERREHGRSRFHVAKNNRYVLPDASNLCNNKRITENNERLAHLPGRDVSLYMRNIAK
jgi:hypothetical protein